MYMFLLLIVAYLFFISILFVLATKYALIFHESWMSEYSDQSILRFARTVNIAATMVFTSVDFFVNKIGYGNMANFLTDNKGPDLLSNGLTLIILIQSASMLIFVITYKRVIAPNSMIGNINQDQSWISKLKTMLRFSNPNLVQPQNPQSLITVKLIGIIFIFVGFVIFGVIIGITIMGKNVDGHLGIMPVILLVFCCLFNVIPAIVIARNVNMLIYARYLLAFQ